MKPPALLAPFLRSFRSSDVRIAGRVILHAMIAFARVRRASGSGE